MIRCIVWVSQRLRPGAEAPRWSAASSRSVVTTILAGIPAARWTTYGEVVMSGSGVPNAWRVLQAGGTVASQFRWDDPGRHDDPRELLRREGVCFEDKGIGGPVHRRGRTCSVRRPGRGLGVRAQAFGGSPTPDDRRSLIPRCSPARLRGTGARTRGGARANAQIHAESSGAALVRHQHRRGRRRGGAQGHLPVQGRGRRALHWR